MAYKPKVSVITPVHNGDGVVGAAIESVQAQTFDDWELLIVDDGSEDRSASIVSEIGKKDRRIRLIRLAQNSGAAMARNAGIQHARGRYIAFLDSDDAWYPGKIEQQIGFMEANEAVFTYGDYVRSCRLSKEALCVVSTPECLTYRDLLGQCPIGCLTAAYNQERLGKRYMPNVRRGQDWALWLDLTRNGIIARKYPGVEAVYHSGSKSLSANKIQKALDMYVVYRREEKFGRARAFWHLAQFSWNVMRRPW